MDKIAAITVAATLASFILWWFFSKRSDGETAAEIHDGKQSAEIIVDGGYVPGVVTLKRGVPAKLVFIRKDPSNCLEEVVFPDLGIKEKLPVNKPHEVTIDTNEAGEYKYACGMNMFFGKVVVK